MKEFLDQQLMFGPPRKKGACWHNVADLFPDRDPVFLADIARHYGQRVGHLPQAEQSFAIVSEVTPEIGDQSEYYRSLFGFPVTPITLVDFKKMNGVNSLVVPYVNFPETAESITDAGSESWGIHPDLAKLLGHKADFHRLVDLLQGEEGFSLRVPEYKIAQRETFISLASKLLQETQENYAQSGMSTRYPLGLIIRPSGADGGYGSCDIRENNGNILLDPDMKGEHIQTFSTWDQAIQQAYNEMYKEVTGDPEIVIGRRIDRKASPGISFLIKNGQIFPFGLNGQLQVKGSACLGIQTFTPLDEDKLAFSVSEMEGRATAGIGAMVTYANRFKGIPLKDGVLNLDLMIPGFLEQEYCRKRHEEVPLYVAECNPRFTNATDALLLSLNTLRLPQTFTNARGVLTRGIATVDSYGIPSLPSPSAFREVVMEVDDALQKTDQGRIVCRMAATPESGVVFLGKISVLQRALQRSVDQRREKPIRRIVEDVVFSR